MKYISAPAVLIAIGSILVVVGAFWSSLRQSGFEEEISRKNEELANLSKKVVGLVTGGDSYCYFSIDKGNITTHIPLVLLSVGEYPLYDLSARLVDVGT